MARALALILGTVLLSGCADPVYSYSPGATWRISSRTATPACRILGAVVACGTRTDEYGSTSGYQA